MQQRGLLLLEAELLEVELLEVVPLDVVLLEVILLDVAQKFGCWHSLGRSSSKSGVPKPVTYVRNPNQSK